MVIRIDTDVGCRSSRLGERQLGRRGRERKRKEEEEKEQEQEKEEQEEQ